MATKPTTITLVTTEVFKVQGVREAHLLADYVRSTGTPWPPEGSWGLSDLPQVGDSEYEVTVNDGA